LLAMLASAPLCAQSTASGDIVFQKQIAGPASIFPGTLTPQAVESWNSHTHDAIVKSYHNHGAEIDPASAIVSTTLIKFGEHQILKSRAEIPSKLFLYQYAGVAGADFVIILCVSPAGRPFDDIGTECEKQAEQFFESSGVASTNWTKLGTDPKGVTRYFDGKSVRKSGALRYYSLRFELPAPDERGVSYTVMEEAIDCQQKTVTTLKATGYLADGSQAFAYAGQEPARPIAAGSNAGGLANALCSQ
jgi:hypothetical protein